MNRKILVFSLASLGIGVGIGAASVLLGSAFSPTTTSIPVAKHPVEKNSSSPAKPRILYWANPMNPAIHASHPRKDNMGMAYIPVYAHAPTASSPGLAVNARMAQELGVHTVPVMQRKIGQVFSTVGTVAIDQNRVFSVTPRFSGWIRNLAVRAVGDPVQAGSILAQIYSPEMYSAEQEYVLAQEDANAGPAVGRLRSAAGERLRLLGLSPKAIHELAKTGVAQAQVPIVAPASGVVEQIAVHQGGYLSAESSLLEIANLDRVWVQVALYGYQLPGVRVGDRVDLRSPDYPGKVWRGRLRFLYPTQSTQNRTVTARLSVANPGGVLRPGMYVNARVWTQVQPQLAVPDSAILHTERGDFVILRQQGGHFLPVEVQVGPSADGWTAIEQGLRAGERVVDNAQFLLYSESQFQSVRARMLGGNESGRASAPTHSASAPAPSVATNQSAKKPSTSMAGMQMGGGHD
ncbi:efflux RND transporter periplasmic adaptor subunit [Acidithiobacillus sp. AMEEHan]|uniref:efflux RND transporter periplasmic adaptor subunit n=1 Tax=Acidithiobacillus sp. AMEEHan TaxID=2994951 RepID=UPI0027E3E433|nr:efflux RND transporter periplasmic adaptor subunit [Acidithiobacillus sp. AMEEHan]